MTESEIKKKKAEISLNKDKQIRLGPRRYHVEYTDYFIKTERDTSAKSIFFLDFHSLEFKTKIFMFAFLKSS